MKKKIILLLLQVLAVGFAVAQTATNKLEATGNVGVGTTSPGSSSGAILDVQNASGINVQAQFGSTIPIYIITNHANLGFNAYYNSGWKYGAGSAGSYGGALGFDHTSGTLRYWVTPTAGSANEGIYAHTYAFTVLQNGNFGIGTNEPGKRLHVVGINSDASLVLSTPSWNSTDGVDYSALDFTYGGMASTKIARIVGQTVNGGGGNLNFQTPTSGTSNPYTTKMTILRDGNVGIGTSVPETNLDVNGTTKTKQLDVRNDGVGAKIVLYSSNGQSFNQLYANVDDATKLTLQTYQYLDLQTASGGDFVFNPFRDVIWRLYQSNASGAMTLWGYQGKGSFITKDVVSGKIGFRTVFSDGNFKHEFINGNVSIGTTDAQSTLSVNGNINSRKVKVTQTGWADYVFENDYHLPTLKEVEIYIKQHKHLPGIISAKQVEQDGIDLGENQAALLKKIEELTLYVIEMKKEIEQQKATTKAQEKELRALKKSK